MELGAEAWCLSGGIIGMSAARPCPMSRVIRCRLANSAACTEIIDTSDYYQPRIITEMRILALAQNLARNQLRICPSTLHLLKWPATECPQKSRACFTVRPQEKLPTMTCEQSISSKGASGVSDFDPYLLPDANVLDNCFREKNPGALQEHETFFSGLRIRELIDEPLAGKFDYAYLQRIHYYIFQDLYPGWAGTTRTISTAKKERLLEGESVKYADPGKGGSGIESAARVLFDKLEQDSYLQNLDRRAFCEALAVFLSTLWQLHPFREGNTRTIMVMCYHITRQAGHRISLRYVDKMHKDLRDSLVISTLGDLQKLEDFLFVAIGKDDRNKGLVWRIFARLQS